MDALLILLVGALVAFALWTWLAHRGGGGRRAGRARGGGDPLGLRSAREIVEERSAMEEEDLTQMLEAHNARRRRRGEPERTVSDIELLVAAEAHERRRRDEASVDDDLDDLLAATNARRRARGLPERSPEQARREFPG